ncbi:MAG: hypothetical protein ABIN01_24160 [Ferruginibacter sp.]
MKKALISIYIILISVNVFSQVIYSGDNPPPRKYPYHDILIIKNNNKDDHTFTFTSPAQSFKNMVQGQGKLETNKVLHFSPNYKVDTLFVKQNIVNIRKSLPKTFWDFSLWGATYDNEPNQDSIWIMYCFVEINKTKDIKIFSAYKVTFEGFDATIVEQRIDPKIIDLEFIIDKKRLKLLETKLKTLPESQ